MKGGISESQSVNICSILTNENCFPFKSTSIILKGERNLISGVYANHEAMSNWNTLQK